MRVAASLRIRYGRWATLGAAGVVGLMLIHPWSPGGRGAAVPAGTAGPSISENRHQPEDDDRREYRPGPAGRPHPGAASVAAGFATAWARPGASAEAWWAGVAPHSESGFAETLRSVDPANVPARRVTGVPRALRGRTDLAVFTVPTDRGVLEVTLALLDGSWKVVGNGWRTA